MALEGLGVSHTPRTLKVDSNPVIGTLKKSRHGM
ncbi:IS1-like element transposase [Yokenella regensburgei]